MWLVPWVWMGFRVNEMMDGVGLPASQRREHQRAWPLKHAEASRIDWTKQHIHLDNLPIGHPRHQEALSHKTPFLWPPPALQSHDALTSGPVPLPHVIWLR